MGFADRFWLDNIPWIQIHIEQRCRFLLQTPNNSIAIRTPRWTRHQRKKRRKQASGSLSRVYKMHLEKSFGQIHHCMLSWKIGLRQYDFRFEIVPGPPVLVSASLFISAVSAYSHILLLRTQNALSSLSQSLRTQKQLYRDCDQIQTGNLCGRSRISTSASIQPQSNCQLSSTDHLKAQVSWWT